MKRNKNWKPLVRKLMLGHSSLSSDVMCRVEEHALSEHNGTCVGTRPTSAPNTKKGAQGRRGRLQL